MSSSNQRPANRGFRSVLRCAISHYRQVPQRVGLIKFVTQFRDCEIIFGERGEFALNGSFPRRRIIAVPAPDKSTVAAIARKKVLDRTPEAFLCRSSTNPERPSSQDGAADSPLHLQYRPRAISR